MKELEGEDKANVDILQKTLDLYKADTVPDDTGREQKKKSSPVSTKRPSIAPSACPDHPQWTGSAPSGKARHNHACSTGPVAPSPADRHPYNIAKPPVVR